MEFRSLSVILLQIVFIHCGQTQDVSEGTETSDSDTPGSALPRATLTVEPTWSPVFTGESVTLKCEMESYSDWRYQWYKGSSRTAVSQSQTNTFTIRSAADQDQDQYWCRGESDYRPTSSQQSNTVTVTVKERPKAVVSIQSDDQVFVGATVTLRCDIQGGGVSNWQHSWFKDGSSTPVSKEQQYRISSVTESHSGKYTCRGTESGTSRYSHTSDAVTLTVSALPRATLTVEPTWSPVFTGESVTLKCEIESYSNWRYQWYKGSSRTPASQSQKNTFTIRSAADQDQYWCRGERDNRPSSSQRSNPVTLTVKERPKAVVSIQPDKQVFRGETVTLRCDIEGEGVSNWQHSWFKDDSYRPVSNEQQYSISSVTESHSGKYTCRGTESGTSRYSHTSDAVTLTVSALPRATLTVEPTWSPVFTGESVTLKCEIESYSDWRYQWYKGSSRTAASQSQTNTFTIRSAADQDQYWCKGERDNRPSSSQRSNPVTLTVKERPKAVVSIQPDKQVFIEATVTLRCDIEGEGVSNWQYSWFKDDPYRPVSYEQQYSISSVTESHRGKYTCRGTERRTSRYSHTSGAVRLTVSALPRATLTVEPKWSPVFTGESVTLKCEIETYSNWRYQWYKGSSRTAVSQSRTNTFTITSAAGQDQDQYWCRGERDNRPSSSQRSNTGTLTVKERPKAVVSIQPDKQVFIGETVTLRCDIEGEGVSNWQHSWFKDDPYRPVGYEQQYSISSVTESHRGKYTCRGTERRTSRYSHTSDAVTLTVSALPNATLTVEPTWSPVFTGESVTLKCKIESHSDWRYQWYKGSSRTAVNQSQTNTFSIRSAADQDQDQYWCRGERDNRPSSSQPSNTVTLTVKAEKPKPELTSSHKGAALIGNPVVLYCELDQSAGWRFYWSKHTQNPENEIKTETHSYSISSVSVSDGGQYWCRAGRGNPDYYTNYSHALWINTTSVSSSGASFSVLCLLSCLMAVSSYLLVTIVLVVKFYRAQGEERKKKLKLKETDKTEAAD
ncbi:immunoglobulin superfamily member 1-like isoform X2 [Colossoma macropomum]|uniref:immunoglobulin superfamily member 1-like isoform X2 n=1 Tax=Colossoma macropomum TaxID=42526 RepID=UPI0018652AE8|nr:immunoglobulin superfamily member 1-like isoform X2 [Colossoma macropomum]